MGPCQSNEAKTEYPIYKNSVLQPIDHMKAIKKFQKKLIIAWKKEGAPSRKIPAD